jgi:hypothetical protein
VDRFLLLSQGTYFGQSPQIDALEIFSFLAASWLCEVTLHVEFYRVQQSNSRSTGIFATESVVTKFQLSFVRRYCKCDDKAKLTTIDKGRIMKEVFYEPRGYLARTFVKIMAYMRLPHAMPLLLMALLSALSFQATAQVTSLTVTIDPPNPSVNQEVFLVVTQTGPSCKFGYTTLPQVTGFEINFAVSVNPGVPGGCSGRVSAGTLTVSGRYTVTVRSTLGGTVTTDFNVSAIGQTQPVPVIGSLSLVLLCLTLGFVAWFTMVRNGLGARNANKSLLPALLAGLFIAGGRYCLVMCKSKASSFTEE